MDAAGLETEPAAINNSNTQETTDAVEGAKSGQGADLHDAGAAPEEQRKQTPEAAEPETEATEDAADLIPGVEAEVEAEAHTSGKGAHDLKLFVQNHHDALQRYQMISRFLHCTCRCKRH